MKRTPQPKPTLQEMLQQRVREGTAWQCKCGEVVASHLAACWACEFIRPTPRRPNPPSDNSGTEL